MISKIIMGFIMIDVMIALSIMLYWTSNNIEPYTIKMGPAFISFMTNSSFELNNIKLEIPDIPSIPQVPTLEINGFDFSILTGFVNLISGPINVIITLLNVLLDFVSLIIQLFQFIYIIIKNLITFKDTIQEPVTDISVEMLRFVF